MTLLFFRFAFVISLFTIHSYIIGIESRELYGQIGGNETHHLKSWCNFVVMIDPVCILMLCTLSALRVNFDGELRRSDSCEDGMAGDSG